MRFCMPEVDCSKLYRLDEIETTDGTYSGKAHVFTRIPTPGNYYGNDKGFYFLVTGVAVPSGTTKFHVGTIHVSYCGEA
jgi:hypothetical protein